MQINPTIFREYDIRGIAGSKFDQRIVAEYEKWYGKFPGVTLDERATVEIGKAYGTIISRAGGKQVVVGYEERPFGKELKQALIQGITTTGIDVIDVGVSLTPMTYFANAFWKLDGSVNITGSHNIYFYNGFKMMKQNNWPIYGQELQAMHKMIEEEDFIIAPNPGRIENRTDLQSIYFNFIFKQIKLSKKFKVTVDTGNGCAGLFAVDYLRGLGCEVEAIFLDLDTTYPNHVPDPEPPQNLKDLQAAVLVNGSDLGIAFDADGDRVGLVDEKGQIILGDDLLLVLAKDLLIRQPGKTILYDIKCTQLLDTLIRAAGGVPLIHRTGHAPIKETMRRNTSVTLAGETSGHIYFVENYFSFDDGLYSAARVLELLSREGKRASMLTADLPKLVRTPEIKLPITDELKFEVVRRVTGVLKKKYQVLDIDGSRIQFSPDSWGIVRASNTSPYLTVKFEGQTTEEVIRIKNLLADELDQYPEIENKLDRTQVASLTGKLGWL